MRQRTKSGMLLVLMSVLASSPTLALAGDTLLTYAPAKQHARVSDRLIVKMKTPAVAAIDRPQSAGERPLSVREMDQINAAAGIGMFEHHMTSTGAHILSIQSVPTRQGMAQAIAGISKLPNVEYVEEDTIDTIQMVPNDPRYTSAPMWGLMPVTAASVPSSGSVGSYGADFQTAWDTSRGAGVVVGVVDSGIAPHQDIGGPNALVTSGTGSNLVSAGYTFISDCREIDPTADPAHGCAATTSTGTTRTPFSGALDTGDFLSLSDLQTTTSVFYDPTATQAIPSSWHGTHVAGTIAAIGNNSFADIGGAFNAKILPVRVLGKGGGYLSDISEGLRWAAGAHPSISNPNPAKVINLSVGGMGPCGTTQQSAIDAAVAAGAVVVVAAGNDNVDAATVHPSSCNNVISVAAIGRDGRRAAYSNFSSSVPATITLAAPGGDKSIGTGTYDPGIMSTVNCGTTTPVTTAASASCSAAYQGTSMATPHVSAAAALMFARNSGLTPVQVKSILTASNSVTAFPSFVAGLSTTDCATNNNCGAGILNAALAVQNSLLLQADTSFASFGVLPVGSSVNKVITITNISAGSVTTSGSVTITGANASFFSLVSSNCDSVTIAPSGTCQVTVKYQPTSAGSHTAMLTVPATVPTGVTLSGATPVPVTPSSGGGGGGCSIMPSGTAPDASLLLALLAVAAYWLRRRSIRARGEA